MTQSTSPLLIEIFVEELPPKALKNLGNHFAQTIFKELKEQNLLSEASQFTQFATPRRLAVHVTQVLPKALDTKLNTKLMPAAIGFDDQGKPSPALIKKLSALGLDEKCLPNIEKKADGKAESLFIEITKSGTKLSEGVQKALDTAISTMPIPKVMTYQLHDNTPLAGWDSVQFVRPAHSLIALYGEQILPINALGLKAGRTTSGHRFEAKNSQIEIQNADQYEQTLKEQGQVTASFEKRQNEIKAQLNEQCQKLNLQISEDQELLDEVTALVELPNVLACKFDEEFLQVPQECLILTMKANQKYFPLFNSEGKLSNHFLIVSNIKPKDASEIIKGNERVVRPRLADAQFFFEQDKKKTLESRLPQLKNVIYHNQLGTQYERAERVAQIATNIAEKIAPEKIQKSQLAAKLAKADLLTDMVGEFPELQGIMGAYYAAHEGQDNEVKEAIEDHYKPRYAGDELPRGGAKSTATILALADKLETLLGLFSIGQHPTGDKDPFALRRHALGVLRILRENQIKLSLEELINQSLEIYPQAKNKADTQKTLQNYITDRLSGALKEEGYSANEVEAVIAIDPLTSLNQIKQRLKAVRTFATLEQAPALASANKRISNILKKAEAEGKIDAHISEILLKENAEKQLHEQMQQVLPKANNQYENGQYTEALQTLAELRDAVDQFFADVMVNAEELDIKLNRLGLLKTLHQAMNRIADLSRLAT